MGMFDEIVIRYPLPAHTEYQHCVFQTKDLEQQLYCYVITESGQLTLPDRDEDGKWIEPVLNLTQTVYFYRIIDDESGHGWVEYVAQFWEGKLEHIALSKYESVSS